MPTSGWGYKWGNGSAWDSAFLLIPFYLYQYSGDVRALTNLARSNGLSDYLTLGEGTQVTLNVTYR